MKDIPHTYLSGKFSTTLIIPIEIAKKYKIDKPSNVIVEGTADGILIKRLDL